MKILLAAAMGAALAGCSSDTASPGASTGGAGGTPDAAAPTRADALAPAGGGDPTCGLYGGAYLVAQRILALAGGQAQASHNWFYYEIKQTGTELVVTRGLHCGFEVVKKSGLGASVDSMPSWPAFLEKNTSTGRKGTFTKQVGGCHLKLDREYVVRGATVGYYADPTTKLPDVDHPASGGTPGWEDWDQDGKPGFSLKVTSTLASGTLYACQRDWTEYDGDVVDNPDKFKVAITYGNEQIPLGATSDVLKIGSTPSSSPAEHYAWFHRLEPGQASGTPAEICAAVRALKDTLLPEAND